jgi:adenylosuccinate synthase
MPADVVMGLQMGDEGKGKIVDYLSKKGKYSHVVRYQGGPNAGHTVIVEDETFKFHMLPSSVLNPNVCSIIAHGVFVDMEQTVKEIEDVTSRVGRLNLAISKNCHVILPTYKIIDEIVDKSRNIGTTCMGIGPAAVSKYDRSGIRLLDFADIKLLREKINLHFSSCRAILNDFGWDEKRTEDYLLRHYSNIRNHIADTSRIIHDALDSGFDILLEGAQGALLDVDLGCYPYVTSSHPSIGGALYGTGINHRDIRHVIGVVKPYITYSGYGPKFLAEITDTEEGKGIAAAGCEIGVTTGRKRRIGWFNRLANDYVARLNGVTHLVVNKLDILTKADFGTPSNRWYIYTGSRNVEGIFNPVDASNINSGAYKFIINKNTHLRVSELARLPDEVVNFIHAIVPTLVKLLYLGIGPKRDDVLEIGKLV